MRGFWSRKLPAGLLAAVMALSLTPVAFAADCGHNNWSAWQKLDASQHQRRCQSNDCDGIQVAPHKWAAAYETDAGFPLAGVFRLRRANRPHGPYLQRYHEVRFHRPLG